MRGTFRKYYLCFLVILLLDKYLENGYPEFGSVLENI